MGADLPRLLEALGVPARAAALYSQLDRIGPSSASRLSRILRTGAGGVYADLDALRARGLVATAVGARSVFRALPPGPFVAARVKEWNEEAAALLETRAALAQTFDSRETPSAGATGALRLVRGRRSASAVITAALRGARERVRWMTTPAGLQRLVSRADASDALNVGLARGIDVRIVLRSDGGGDASRLPPLLAGPPGVAMRRAPPAPGAIERLVVDEARALLRVPVPDDARAFAGDDLLLDAAKPRLVRDALAAFEDAWSAAAADVRGGEQAAWPVAVEPGPDGAWIVRVSGVSAAFRPRRYVVRTGPAEAGAPRAASFDGRQPI